MDGKYDSAVIVWRSVRVWIKSLANNINFVSHLSMHDLKILEDFNLERPHISMRPSKIVKWSRPPSGWVKLNCDGSCRGNRGNSGGGGIIRNWNGLVKGAFSAHYGVGTNSGAEMKAILDGIRLCKRLHLSNVIIESDSQIIVDWLCMGKCSVWYLWDFWEALRKELEGLNFVVVHQLREGNSAADFLAREGEMGLNVTYNGNQDFPRFLKGIVRLDFLGILYLRR
ncbi:ribonuclease H-like [Juglans regia]|uniref:Ribonuclease H-like n=1 Tax=Juglans regia TaxID=51240 RepID=A0A6P9EVJ7_JUGRE|nr:ribonuclease H-like [Juglans regia]